MAGERDFSALDVKPLDVDLLVVDVDLLGAVDADLLGVLDGDLLVSADVGLFAALDGEQLRRRGDWRLLDVDLR